MQLPPTKILTMSKLMLFDFECPACGNVFEDLIPSDGFHAPCPGCTGNAKRLISAARLDVLKMGLDPGFPTAYEKWGDMKTQHHKTDKGTMHKGKAPNLLMY